MPVYAWSPTASANRDILTGITLDGSVMNVPTVDDAFRDMSAQIAQQLGKIGHNASDMPSAATVNLGTASGWYVNITGSTAISSFGTADPGMTFILCFTGILTLTNSASLILPGGANITTASGDTATMVSLGSGVWRCTDYQKYIPTTQMTGDVISLTGSPSAAIYMNKTAVTATDVCRIGAFANGKQRWVMDFGNGAESGGNTGSNFYIFNYDDAGNSLSIPFQITRATSATAIAGPLSVGGNVTSSNWFIASTTVAGVATTGAGTIYFRPNGTGSAVGQAYLNSAGSFYVNNDFISGTGAGNASASSGWDTGVAGPGVTRSARATNAATNHYIFYAPAGQAGFINTTGATTQYGATSDARLKQNVREYDPAEAMALILADPVQRFNWISTEMEGVGWLAQKSHAVNPDFAIEPPEEFRDIPPGEEDFSPWGIDYGRRTPYLWAALAGALKRIEALEERLAALEAKGA